MYRHSHKMRVQIPHCVTALLRQVFSLPTHTSDRMLIVLPPYSCCWSTLRLCPSPFSLCKATPKKTLKHQHMWTSHGIETLPCMPHLSALTPISNLSRSPFAPPSLSRRYFLKLPADSWPPASAEIQ